MNLEVFNKNFEKALSTNFPDKLKYMSREFGHQLFIEMPILNLDPKHSMFEQQIMFKLNEVPVSIQLQSKVYVLYGVFLFRTPLIDGDTGHYVGAVRKNDYFEIYDDLRTKPYMISTTEEDICCFRWCYGMCRDLKDMMQNNDMDEEDVEFS